MNHFLIEITQEQLITVEVEADCELAALESVHNQRGQVVARLEPEMVTSKSRVIRFVER